MAELKKERKGIDWSKIDLNDMITDDLGYEKSIFKDKEQADKEKAIQDMLARRNPIENPNKMGKVKFGDPIKDKKWLVYGLIAVAGYFAYKKFKK
ncbi:MAG: hypothetical protein P1U29_03845 [Candidatus Pelagibacter bacterium]|nr:hypothetical protein [Candidatus Pelagibacter bacterium]